MIVRNTKPEEARRVNELFSIAFELPIESGPADENNDRIHHWAAFSEDGNMMSTFSISDYQIHFDGSSCKMGGIGGVATLPQYRRKGGIRACFCEALPEMYRQGYDFSYLYPFSTGYYRKFGYEACVQKYAVSVHLGLLNPPPVSGEFRLAEAGWPMTEAIAQIDRVWERQYNMMVIHDPEDYEWTAKAAPAEKQEFTYVYFDGEKVPKSYVTFRMVMEPDGRNLKCSRFACFDKEGFFGLMHLFKSLSSDHMFAKFTVPSIAAQQYLMPEWSMGAAQWTVQPAGMVRVINVESVLKKARYLGSGEAVLQIEDKHIPQNNGCYSVTFRDGHATNVERTATAPDGCFTIPAFSALISGVTDLESARQWMDGLEIINEGSLSQIFFPKPLMIADYF